MKEALVLGILLMTSFCGTAIGQSPSSATEPIVGLRAGLGYTTIVEKPSFGLAWDHKFGMLGGCFMEFPLDSFRIFSLSVDILYVQKGATFSFNAEGSEVKAKFACDEVVISPLVKTRLLSNRLNVFLPFLELGPAIGFNTRCRASVASGNVEVSAHINGWRKTGLDAVFGVGAGRSTGRSELCFTLRYHYGLTDMYRPEGAEDAVNTSLRGLYLVLSYSFFPPSLTVR